MTTVNEQSAEREPIVIRACVEQMNAVVEDTEIDPAEWDAMTPAQRRELIQSIGTETMNNAGGYGASLLSGAPESDLDDPEPVDEPDAPLTLKEAAEPLRRRRPPLDRIAEPNPDDDGEPLETQIRRIIRSRDVGQYSAETTAKLILAALAHRLPVPAGALDAEAWGERELAAGRNPTSAGYLDYLLGALREQNRRASHEGPTVSAVVAERFQGGEQR